MDDATKERFKWKFYKLTVLLNVVILVYALSVMALFMGGAFALPLFAGLGILIWNFISLILRSQNGPNRYGPNPLEVTP